MKIIKYGAKWCPGCKIMGPRWKEIESEMDWVNTEYIGVDENPQAVNEYKILSLPTFIFFDKEGEEIERFTGIVEKEILVEAVKRNKDK